MDTHGAQGQYSGTRHAYGRLRPSAAVRSSAERACPCTARVGGARKSDPKDGVGLGCVLMWVCEWLRGAERRAEKSVTQSVGEMAYPEQDGYKYERETSSRRWQTSMPCAVFPLGGCRSSTASYQVSIESVVAREYDSMLMLDCCMRVDVQDIVGPQGRCVRDGYMCGEHH